MRQNPKISDNSQQNNKITTLNVPSASSQQQQIRVSHSSDKGYERLNQREFRIGITNGELKNRTTNCMQTGLTAENESEFPNRGKSGSYNPAKTNQPTINQKEDLKLQHHKYNSKSKIDLKLESNIEQQKNERKIKYIEECIDKLQNYKQKQQQYLMKVMNKDVSVNPIMKSSTSSISFSAKSRISVNFDVNEYIAICQKQRQQAKLIEEKAMKLRKKQKLEREMLKKMKNKLLSQQNTERSQVQSGIGIGVGMDISAISIRESPEKDHKLLQHEKMSKSNLQNFRFNTNQDEVENQKSIGYSIDQQKSIQTSRQNDLQRQLKKQLEAEKISRQNYEKHISQLNSKNAQIFEQYNKKIASLQQKLQEKEKQISSLQHQINKHKQDNVSIDVELDIVNKKYTEASQKIKQLSGEIKQLKEKKADLTVQQSTIEITQIFESSVKEISRQIYDICQVFSITLVQKQLIKEVKKYLEYLKKFVGNLQVYTKNKEKRLEGYIHKYSDIIEKESQDIGIHTPQINSSPNVGSKDPDIQKKSRFATKHMQSLVINLGESQSHQQEIKVKEEDTEKKSILLSQDFGSAFSHEDDEGEGEMGSRYNSKDKVNEKQDSREKNKLNDSLSQGFSKSTHSLMEQLQAQEQTKKDMRNLKMKAKQKRRKV